MKNSNGPGRPKKPPTSIIRVPVDCIEKVGALLGREIATNQRPHVMIRVPDKNILEIRELIKCNKK